MSTRKHIIHRKKRHNYKNYREIRRQIELQNEFLCNESFKLELKQAKREDKLQRGIWKKPGWKDYTC